MKRLTQSILSAVLLAGIPAGSVMAVSTFPTPLPSSTPVASAQQPARLNRLRTHGAAEIDRRLDSLSKALVKLQASTKLSAIDKAALAKQTQAEIDGLTALKTKLAAETGLAAARQDVTNIYTEYRVYYLMLPKTRMVAAADRFAETSTTLDGLVTKLQGKIDAAKANKQDVSAGEHALIDMKTKLADAKGKYDGLTAKLLLLKPADYDANHTVLVDYREGLKAARLDFKAARDDAKLVISSIKGEKADSATK